MALHASHLNNLHANRPGGNEQGTLYSIECLHGVREGEGYLSLFTFHFLPFPPYTLPTRIAGVCVGKVWNYAITLFRCI